jgi:hypothetical protein
MRKSFATFAVLVVLFGIAFSGTAHAAEGSTFEEWLNKHLSTTEDQKICVSTKKRHVCSRELTDQFQAKILWMYHEDTATLGKAEVPAFSEWLRKHTSRLEDGKTKCVETKYRKRCFEGSASDSDVEVLTRMFYEDTAE